jgi:methylenetetrahydrofolate reductase (NADPH)
MGRIIDKIRKRRRLKHVDPAQPTFFWSFEFFPPKTEAGLENLLTRMDRMTMRLDPLFIDVTWGAVASTEWRSLHIAEHAQKYLGVDALLHLSCQGMSRDDLKRVLKLAKDSGTQNILALRGDPPIGKPAWEVNDVSGGDCDRAIDLVRLIRQEYGQEFGIAIAGHPEGHPSSTSREEELMHLKEKVDAGADFIITQFFYNTDVFIDYVRDCRNIGITCPIIPGIMPIQSYNVFEKMTRYCNISVPLKVWALLDPVKDDDEAIKAIGCDLAAEMCHRIIKEADGVDGVHFYTLNLERSVTQILIRMGAVDFIQPELENLSHSTNGNASSAGEILRTTSARQFPWRPSAMEKRSAEQIRPINWANRPKSYVLRTEDWDEFPNGRWGDSTSPAFGELSQLSHFYQFSLGSLDDQREMLGRNPTEPKDVYEIFARYVEGKLPHIPWCEAALQPESFLIQDKLATLNRSGCLTINSQPSANGLPSSHKTFGWGGPGGYVYQKEYCECFCSPSNMEKLALMVKKNPSMHLYAVNVHGVRVQEGTELGGVTALTWGVFPNREIVQPTIFDPDIFVVWSEEAFSLWTTMWLNLYEFDTTSYDLIETIRDTYFLCAIIDNNFIEEKGNDVSLWEIMLQAVSK